jgi:hypothetical protein
MLLKEVCPDCQLTCYAKDIIKNSFRDSDNLF